MKIHNQCIGKIMSILGKIVSTIATKSIIKTVGETATDTTAGIFHAIDQHNKNKVSYNETKQAKSYNKQQMTDVVKVPDFQEYIGQHYLKARAVFIANGFLDISYVVKKDIKKGIFRKDGEVEEISVNGKTDIRKNAKVPHTSPVVIVYHTFAENKNNSQQESKNLSVSNCSIDCFEAPNFCGNCGQKLKSEQKFCTKCGQKI